MRRPHSPRPPKSSPREDELAVARMIEADPERWQDIMTVWSILVLQREKARAAKDGGK